MTDGMSCICHYNGILENDNGQFKYIGGEAKLRHIRNDVTFPQFVQMMEVLCANNKNETSILVQRFFLGVLWNIKEDKDFQAMFPLYQNNPQYPLRIWITKQKISGYNIISGSAELTCSPKLVDNAISHRHSRKTTKLNLSQNENGTDIIISTVDALPAQYIFTIKSFSLLSKNSVEKYDCIEFASGGYKWKLSLYPSGNKSENVKDHISLYLVMVDASSLPSGWELDVVFRFYLFDHIANKYVTVQGGLDGRFRRFHESKTEWGFSHFIPLKTFSDPAKGFLVNDTCIVGADIFVSKPLPSSESLTVVKENSIAMFTWKFAGFSNITDKYVYSDEFKAGGHDWQIRLYPNYIPGNISLYFYLNRMQHLVHQVYAILRLRLRDQESRKHVDYEDARWFDWSGQYCGRDEFMRMDVFRNEENGFLVNDTCFIEAEVTIANFN